MSWQEIVGHDKQAEYFRRNLQQRRLASAFLFLGPEGIGKRKFALKLAQTLFCEKRDAVALDPCGKCPSCKQTLVDTHPDLHFIAVDRDKGKRSIIKAQIVGGKKTASDDPGSVLDYESGGRIADQQRDVQPRADDSSQDEVFNIKPGELSTHYPGLCYQLHLKPAQANRQIAIIDDADCMQDEAANALLKTLEEPPSGSVLILLASNPKKILTTIHSRCQTVLFHSLEDEEVQQILLENEIVQTTDQAWVLASLAGGSVQVALSTTDGVLVEVREQICQLLPTFSCAPYQLAAVVEDYVSTPKENPTQRARFQQVAQIVLSILRLMLLQRIGVDHAGDELAKSTVQAMLSHWEGDEETIMACVDRTIDAVTQLDANANIKTLIDAWIDDLAQIQIVGGFMVPGY